MTPSDTIESNATSTKRRTAILRRATRETRIEGGIDLDPVGPNVDVATGKAESDD